MLGPLCESSLYYMMCIAIFQLKLVTVSEKQYINHTYLVLRDIPLQIGEFVHTRSNMKIPDDGGKKIYSVNEGNSIHWDRAIQSAVQYFKNATKPYSARYVGSMVADIHRTLLYGGIFMYPADRKSPSGKLRCLYEGIPMAMIIEQAGGVASTGYFESKIRRILDLVPASIHCRCPIVMGSKRDVQVVYDMYRKEMGITNVPVMGVE